MQHLGYSPEAISQWLTQTPNPDPGFKQKAQAFVGQTQMHQGQHNQLIDYFIKMGLQPPIAVDLASKIGSTSPHPSPIANGVRPGPIGPQGNSIPAGTAAGDKPLPSTVNGNFETRAQADKRQYDLRHMGEPLYDAPHQEPAKSRSDVTNYLPMVMKKTDVSSP